MLFVFEIQNQSGFLILEVALRSNRVNPAARVRLVGHPWGWVILGVITLTLINILYRYNPTRFEDNICEISYI